MDVRFEPTVEGFAEYVTDLGLDHVELKREYLAGHPDTPSPTELGAIADRHGVSLTLHAPFRDWNIGSFNDAARRASVEQVRQCLDDAATAGAGAVVVHGGGVPSRYPEWVREKAAANARQSLAECAAYANEVGVPLCLENQPANERTQRYTTTPKDLAEMLAAVPDAEQLGITLDVGHATANGYDWRAFVDRFGDRIRVCHVHDNDGTGDHHDPHPAYEEIVETVPAEYFVFEMKSVADVARCVGREGETAGDGWATSGR